ncbi:MAG: type III-A CRISPR-associated RAMP protein Csm4 [Syntrophobacteraceae bacterium]|nr:type III-A CRISPR-associated RAMP protein Csm4 [Syntrophobacteraceae bacterium]
MELDLKVVEIRLRSGMHLGEREGWLEGTGVFPLSDTLFSAFCNGYRLLYGEEELDALLQAFLDGPPPFRLSSGFPKWKGLYFFPAPLNQIAAEKDVKNIRWIEKAGWERLLRGEAIEEVLKASSVQYIPKPGPNCQAKETEEPPEPWKILETPRVGLDRTNNHPGERYFQFGQVHFYPDASYFFLADVASEDVWERLKAVWRLLADEGIGGDRSVGKGLYHSPSFAALRLSLPDRAENQALLSLFYPSPSETGIIGEGYYEFIERKGYLYSPASQGLRRNAVRLFKTGSVFPSSRPLRGRLMDVTPEIFTRHRVYRYGIALSVPCRLRGESHAGSHAESHVG